MSAGSRLSIRAATRASRAGWDSKRYLSKYSDDTWPDRSVNWPDRRQIASMSRARVGSGVVSSMAVSLAVVLATRLQGIAPTIFSRMSALAVSTGAVNLGQGFPDVDGPPSVIAAAVEALQGGRNQYAPGAGVPELRQAIARHQQRHYGIELDPDTEVRRDHGLHRGGRRRPARAGRTPATRSSCSSPTTTPTSRCSRWPAPYAARSRCGRPTSASTPTTCGPPSRRAPDSCCSTARTTPPARC